MIFHVLNAAHKKTHSILADDFRVSQSTTDNGPRPATLHTVIEFLTRDTTSHWLRADVVTEAVVARVKTTKDYTVIAVSAIDTSPLQPSKKEQERLRKLYEGQQNIGMAHPNNLTGLSSAAIGPGEFLR